MQRDDSQAALALLHDVQPKFLESGRCESNIEHNIDNFHKRLSKDNKVVNFLQKSLDVSPNAFMLVVASRGWESWRHKNVGELKGLLASLKEHEEAITAHSGLSSLVVDYKVGGPDFSLSGRAQGLSRPEVEAEGPSTSVPTTTEEGSIDNSSPARSGDDAIDELLALQRDNMHREQLPSPQVLKGLSTLDTMSQATTQLWTESTADRPRLFDTDRCWIGGAKPYNHHEIFSAVNGRGE